MQKFLAMAVTKLERKGRKNKTVAKVRVATIKRLRTKSTVGSDYKEESGQVIGDAADIVNDMKSAPKAKKAAKPTKKAAKPAKKVEEAPAEVVEEPKAEATQEAPASDEKTEEAAAE